MLSRVYVEITNRCNLQCSFCPEVGRPGKELDVPRAREYFAKIAPVCREVTFHLMGEPLSHPSFAELLTAAEDMGMAVTLTTNGTLLPRHGQGILASNAVRQVNVSLQAFPDNFPGQDGKGYLKGVLDFAGAARELRSDLWLNYRIWNLEKVDHGPVAGTEAPGPAGNPGPETPPSSSPQTPFDFMGDLLRFYQVPVNLTVDPGHRKGKSLGGRHRLHFDSRFRWPSPSDPDLGPSGFCHGLSTHVGVHVDGTVVPCCLDKEARIPLGNLHEAPLEQILASPRASAMREGFARGALTEDLCRRCTYRERFNGKARTLAQHKTKQIPR